MRAVSYKEKTLNRDEMEKFFEDEEKEFPCKQAGVPLLLVGPTYPSDGYDETKNIYSILRAANYNVRLFGHDSDPKISPALLLALFTKKGYHASVIFQLGKAEGRLGQDVLDKNLRTIVHKEAFDKGTLEGFIREGLSHKFRIIVYDKKDEVIDSIKGLIKDLASSQ